MGLCLFRIIYVIRKEVGSDLRSDRESDLRSDRESDLRSDRKASTATLAAFLI